MIVTCARIPLTSAGKPTVLAALPKVLPPSAYWLMTFGVTGATGRIGSELVRELRARGLAVRALVHTPARATALTGQQVEMVPGDFADPDSLDRAVAGVEQVFLLSPPHPHQVQLQGNLVQAAQRAGVRHIVKLSALGASPDWPLPIPRWHWETEQQIEQAGFAFTHLRPNYFMQMILTLAPQVIQQGTLVVPAGAGRVSMVDARDIAAVAVAVLVEPGHAGQVYEITGPEALSFVDVAQQLTATTGRPVKYVDISPESACLSAIPIKLCLSPTEPSIPTRGRKLSTSWTRTTRWRLAPSGWEHSTTACGRSPTA